jgi:hypothetical protein
VGHFTVTAKLAAITLIFLTEFARAHARITETVFTARSGFKGITATVVHTDILSNRTMGFDIF